MLVYFMFSPLVESLNVFERSSVAAASNTFEELEVKAKALSLFELFSWNFIFSSFSIWLKKETP